MLEQDRPLRSFSSCCLSKVRDLPDAATAHGARADALLCNLGRCRAAALLLRGAPFVCVARHGGAPKGWRGCPAARRSAAPRALLASRAARAPKTPSLRHAGRKLRLAACLPGHRGRSAGSRSAVASLLFAAVRAWRSSQAFPVKRRGPRLARVAGCRGPWGSPRSQAGGSGGRLHKICFRDCRRARLFLAGAAPRG